MIKNRFSLNFIRTIEILSFFVALAGLCYIFFDYAYKPANVTDGFGHIKFTKVSDTLYSKNTIDSLNERFKATVLLLQSDSNKINVAVSNRLEILVREIDSLKAMTLGLRQSINPKNPEEILTIARLKDQIASINDKMEQMTSNLSVQQKSFEDATKREIDASSRSNTPLLFVLVPLVLNFSYQIWKDLKASRQEQAK